MAAAGPAARSHVLVRAWSFFELTPERLACSRSFASEKVANKWAAATVALSVVVNEILFCVYFISGRTTLRQRTNLVEAVATAATNSGEALMKQPEVVIARSS